METLNEILSGYNNVFLYPFNKVDFDFIKYLNNSEFDSKSIVLFFDESDLSVYEIIPHSVKFINDLKFKYYESTNHIPFIIFVAPFDVFLNLFDIHKSDSEKFNLVIKGDHDFKTYLPILEILHPFHKQWIADNETLNMILCEERYITSIKDLYSLNSSDNRYQISIENIDLKLYELHFSEVCIKLKNVKKALRFV